jgi:hypothetical protein
MQIPAIAGKIFRETSVSLAARTRAAEWVGSFKSLSTAQSEGRLTLWQIRDNAGRDDPGGEDKAAAVVFESSLDLRGLGSVPAFVLLHYRGTDPFNRDFQTTQARRLGDSLGMDWLRQRDVGVFLTVHHGIQGDAGRLEIGDHRVVCDFHELLILPSKVNQPGVKIAEETTETSVSIPDLARDAPMVWSLGNASIRPLGVLPRSTLAFGSPVVPEISDYPVFESLVGSALNAYGASTARILFDKKSDFRAIAESVSFKPRFWRRPSLSRSGLVVTALPKGLSSSSQETLAGADWPAYLPFLPWHTGRFVFGGGF